MKQFLFGSTLNGTKWFNIAWLLFRFYIGFTIAIGAGWPKMYEITAPGWFVKQVGELGFTFPSPAFWAAAAAWGEFVGGLCIAFGFFTRISAIQLAFQFFVVAFIWYNEPAPMIGMYYQQLLFWGFVLIAVAGAGKYSVDHWIMNKPSSKSSIGSFAPAGMLVLFFLLVSFHQKQEPILKPSELNHLQGTWHGVLTYIDYTSGFPTNIETKVHSRKKDDEQNSRVWLLKYEYPKEPGANAEGQYELSKDGSMINGEKIVEKEQLKDGSLKIAFERRGKDGNDQKPCTIRTVIQLNVTDLVILKLVKFDGEQEYFQRNQYKLTK
ncbi:MAG: DoxX family protein [Chitinophagaceae bacterium]|nr:DoxX family protein [Chitinophagaceae bacterium]